MTLEENELQAALADAFQDAWGHLAWALGKRSIRKAEKTEDEWWRDFIDDYGFDILGLGLQRPAVLAPMTQVFLQGVHNAAMQVAIEWNYSHPAALAWARTRAAEMVGMKRLPDGRLIAHPDPKWSILPATRKGLKSLIAEHLDEGHSWNDIEDGIAAMPGFSGVFGSYRAEMIARTEVAFAANAGTVACFTEHGVDKVRVKDNHDCPLCKPVADTVQTIAWAQANPLGHPNCIRSFEAIL